MSKLLLNNRFIDLRTIHMNSDNIVQQMSGVCQLCYMCQMFVMCSDIRSSVCLLTAININRCVKYREPLWSSSNDACGGRQQRSSQRL